MKLGVSLSRGKFKLYELVINDSEASSVVANQSLALHWQVQHLIHTTILKMKAQSLRQKVFSDSFDDFDPTERATSMCHYAPAIG